MKILAMSIAALAASIGAAQADSFTFSGTSKTLDQVGGMVAGGETIGAQFFSGQNNVTGSGKTWVAKFTCATWTAEPASGFSARGMCNVNEGTADKFTVAFSCQALDKSGASDCWGRLTGSAGKYVGKVGEASWHGTQSADHMTGTSSGTGMWN